MQYHGCFVRGLVLISLLLAPSLVVAQTFSSGSTGADGSFNPPTTVPPGTTVSGSTYTVPLPASGIYNFTTIAIPSGITVRFTRNAANTPVILMATGNVVINGLIDVSGSDATPLGRPGAGGPGGFDGGAGADGLTLSAGGFGLGPGGGGGGSSNGGGGGGSYATAGGASSGAAGQTYGSPLLRPIVGGSGGGGGGGAAGSNIGGGAGGGGGAILIASSTSITLQSVDQYNRPVPVIRANGGNGAYGVSTSGATGSGGAGSGGAIRLIAPTITGTARLEVTGGTGNSAAGGSGRIRLEAVTLAFTGSASVVMATGYPSAVFPPTGPPTLTIASVGGVAAPASPKGTFLDPPDVVLPVGTGNPVEVVLTASNIPLGTTIQLTATPQSGSRAAATSTGLGGTVESSTATASITLTLSQTSVLTAMATFPLTASLGTGPLYAAGEEVKWVRVAATFGRASTVTYITASGKEVPATALASQAP